MSVSADDHDRRLAELLEAWFDAVESGQEPSLEEHCRDCPELVADLARLLDEEGDAADLLAELGASAIPSPIPVSVLGDFRILSFLGSGGMGQVYLARQESLGRLVALKIIRLGSGDPTSVVRFHREAKISAALEHPNIVPVHAVGESDGYAYLAMKWLSGPSLDQLTQPLTPKAAAEIGRSVALALHEAHQSGVVHRDVKPGNIMLDGEVPFVLDFGLARAAAGPSVTRSGAAPGTLPYMAPEQLTGSRDHQADPRTDVYGLGATLYELTTGRAPFGNDDPDLLMGRILSRDPEPLGLSAADRDFETIVRRALEKEPGRRFQTAEALAQDLERYLAGIPILSRPSGPITRVVKLVRRHRVPALVVFGSFLLVLAVLAVVSFRGAQESQRQEEERGRRVASHRDGFSAALRVNDFDAARKAVAQIREEGGHADEVREARQRLVAAESLEELFDRAMEGVRGQSPTVVDRVLRRIEESGATFDEERSRTYRVLRALLAAGTVAGEPADAEKWLSGLNGRDVSACRALVEGRDFSNLPAAGEFGTSEHLLTLAAMKIAERPRDELSVEIRDARRLIRRSHVEGEPDRRDGDRVSYADAVWHAQDLETIPEALVAFEGLADRGVYAGSVYRNLMLCYLLQRRIDAAVRAYDEFLRVKPDPETWAPADLSVVFEVLATSGRFDAAVEALRAARIRYPDEPEIRLLSVTAGVSEDPVGDLRFVEQSHRSREQRHLALALLLRVEMDEAGVSPLNRFALDVDRTAFRSRADALLAENPVESARALLLHVRSMTFLAEEPEYQAALWSAVSVPVANPEALVDLGNLLFRLPSPPKDLWDRLALECEATLSDQKRGWVRASPEDAARVLFFLGCARLMGGDSQGAERSLADFLQLLEDVRLSESPLPDPHLGFARATWWTLRSRRENR